MTLPLLKAVIFDMDGVLVDSEHYYHRRRERFMNSLGIRIPPAEAFVGTNDAVVWKLMVPEDEVLRAKLRRQYSLYCEEHPTPYAALAAPGVRELFCELKQRGLKIAIASSSAPWMIECMAEQLGLTQWIDSIHSGVNCKAHKPDPEIYLQALEALGISAAEAVAVEDSAPGIQAAQAAGLKTFACAAFCDCPETQQKAQVILPALTDILQHL